MGKMNQKEAVFGAVNQVLTEAGIKVDSGTDFRPHMTKEFRAQVNQILFEGFRNGDIELEVEKTDSELKSYVSGLQSNWLNKDKRLNGNTKYVAKNPGSRTGSTDPQIKALRALLAQKTDEDEKAEIQSYIDERLEALGIDKAKKQVKVNFDDLPPELQVKYAPTSIDHDDAE